MLKQLRWKITGLIMGVVVILLAAVFLALYSSTALSYRNRSMEAMRSALQQNQDPQQLQTGQTRPGQAKPQTQPQPDSPPPPRQEISAVAVVEIGTPITAGKTSVTGIAAKNAKTTSEKTSEATGVVLENHIPALSDEDAVTFALLAEKEEKDCGLLKEQHLRYMRQKTPQGTIRYALADTFGEDHALRTQMFHSGAVALLALLAFFLASCLLSRRLVAPVETAWKQQQQFVADASHELKTPLTVILSNTSLLLRDYADHGNLSPEATTTTMAVKSRNEAHIDHRHTAMERTLRIQSEAARMKQLVESLLLLARSDSGRLSQDYRHVDFSYLIESSVMAFEPVAFENGREIEADIAEGIELYGNETRLRQLADILIDNACKYSNPGSAIQVRLGEKKEKHTVLFSVTSEGKPLSEDEQRQIFLRFYRADPSRGEIPGFGLGLSIASSIVKEHGGNIQVSSDGIQKNIFTVTLPKRKEQTGIS